LNAVNLNIVLLSHLSGWSSDALPIDTRGCRRTTIIFS
jgi:hypothetical protein